MSFDLVMTYPGTGGSVRVLGTLDAPEFVAADVCAALGINNVSKAVAGLDSDEKGVTPGDTPGGAAPTQGTIQ